MLAIAVIALINFATNLAIAWGFLEGGPIGGIGWMIGMISISHEITDQFLNWVLSIQQSAFLNTRRKRYAKNNSLVSELPI